MCLLEAIHLFRVDGELGKVNDKGDLEISLLLFRALWHSGHPLLQHLSLDGVTIHLLKCFASGV